MADAAAAGTDRTSSKKRRSDSEAVVVAAEDNPRPFLQKKDSKLVDPNPQITVTIKKVKAHSYVWEYFELFTTKDGKIDKDLKTHAACTRCRANLMAAMAKTGKSYKDIGMVFAVKYSSPGHLDTHLAGYHPAIHELHIQDRAREADEDMDVQLTTLDDYPEFNTEKARTDALRNTIVKWIVMTDQPLNTASKPAFHNLTWMLTRGRNSGLSITGDTVGTTIEIWAAQMMNAITQFVKGRSLTLSTDGWTSKPGGGGFVGLVAHGTW